MLLSEFKHVYKDYVKLKRDVTQDYSSLSIFVPIALSLRLW
jgi:hypothetical protein